MKPLAFQPGDFKCTSSALYCEIHNHKVHLNEVLAEIKRSGMRIIIFMAHGEDMKATASSAAQQGMTSAGWGWITMEGSPAWASLQMQGWIDLHSELPSEGMLAFAQQVSNYTKSAFNISISAEMVDLFASVALYTAVMLYANAVTKLDDSLGWYELGGQEVTNAIQSTTIEGVGNSVVEMDEHGDRVESYEVVNYVLSTNSRISFVAIGVYRSTEKQYTAFQQAVVWPGFSTDVPIDYLSTVHPGFLTCCQYIQ